MFSLDEKYVIFVDEKCVIFVDGKYVIVERRSGAAVRRPTAAPFVVRQKSSFSLSNEFDRRPLR